jgi:hypothetical protein
LNAAPAKNDAVVGLPFICIHRPTGHGVRCRISDDEKQTWLSWVWLDRNERLGLIAELVIVQVNNLRDSPVRRGEAMESAEEGLSLCVSTKEMIE